MEQKRKITEHIGFIPTLLAIISLPVYIYLIIQMVMDPNFILDDPALIVLVIVFIAFAVGTWLYSILEMIRLVNDVREQNRN